MAVRTQPTRAARLRQRLGHPIVDADGHILEFIPVFTDYLRDELGAAGLARFERHMREKYGRFRVPPARKREEGAYQPIWLRSAPASNALDLATSYLPALLANRLDDFGFDYTVLYGTAPLEYGRIADEEVRRGAIRAANKYAADLYFPYADRLTIAAVIPMHTPAEAIEELEWAKARGFKTIMIMAGLPRPIPAVHRKYPELFPQLFWLDTYGLDSAYDYDPVWAKCRELGFAVTFHGGQPLSNDSILSRSVTNGVFNHMGSFAFLMYQVCKSLVFGGVTRRFPDLTFAFLECGVGWATVLFANLIEYWEKRRIEMIERRDFKQLDRAAFRRLHEEWGGALTAGRLDDAWLASVTADNPPPERDEWKAMDIKEARDFYDRFVPNLYFGCEADDRTVSIAFSKANPFDARLKVMLSSDIGHWDVMDMENVLPESYELVEEGVLTPEEFRLFTFENPALLHLRMNPDFFRGTRLESEAERLLQRGSTH